MNKFNKIQATQNKATRNTVKIKLFLLFTGLMIGNSHFLYSNHHHDKHKTLTYYLNISDFANSFIEIPTSNVSGDSTTIASSYLAGRAPLYDKHNRKVGICSASFL